MKRRNVLVLMLAALCAVPGLSTTALSQSGEEAREEFHQSYPLASGGTVSLKNMNGAVQVKGWDRDEVKVDAIKKASSAEKLGDVKIEIDTASGGVHIRTVNSGSNLTWTSGENGRRNNPPSVEFSLMVPRGARIHRIELINGSLDIEGLNGNVTASTINGRVKAQDLSGRVKLSTINGKIEATFDRLDNSDNFKLDSINGQVELMLASDANVELKADTVHGKITNDIGLPVKKGKYVGRSLAGMLGRGGARIDLNNVNGAVEIRRASDGRQPSIVTNRLQPDTDNDR